MMKQWILLTSLLQALSAQIIYTVEEQTDQNNGEVIKLFAYQDAFSGAQQAQWGAQESRYQISLHGSRNLTRAATMDILVQWMWPGLNDKAVAESVLFEVNIDDRELRVAQVLRKAVRLNTEFKRVDWVQPTEPTNLFQGFDTPNIDDDSLFIEILDHGFFEFDKGTDFWFQFRMRRLEPYNQLNLVSLDVYYDTIKDSIDDQTVQVFDGDLPKEKGGFVGNVLDREDIFQFVNVYGYN